MKTFGSSRVWPSARRIVVMLLPLTWVGSGSLVACRQLPPGGISSLVKVEKGEIPVVLSAPHGGSDKVPDVPPRSDKDIRQFVVVRDSGTDVLADALAEELQKRLGKRPFLVRARFHRRYIDANRPAAEAYESVQAKPIYDAYHRALADACAQVQKQFGRGLLLDIHGQAARVDTVIRGTVDGKTVRLLRQRFGEKAHFGPESLMGRLAENGLIVYPTKPDEKEIASFRGGYTVQTYGSHDRFGIDAVQLEFGSNYRKKDTVKKTAAQVAKAVEQFARQYLPVEATAVEPRTVPPPAGSGTIPP